MKRIAAFLLSALITGALIAETITLTLPDGSEWAIEATPINGGGAGESPPDGTPPVDPPEQPAPPPPVPDPAPVPVPVPVPDPTPEPPTEYTRLGPIPNQAAHMAGKRLPRIRSIEASWNEIGNQCAKWTEITVPYSPELQYVGSKNSQLCIKATGETGPNGELTRVQLAPGMRGLWGVKLSSPKYVPSSSSEVFVWHLGELSGWGRSHALITPNSNTHMIVEILDSVIHEGSGSHAIYVDRAAYFRFERNEVYRYGKQHGIRSIAAYNIIRDNLCSNAERDGSYAGLRGQNCLEFYANGEGIVTGNRVLCYYPDGPHDCVRMRSRPAMQGLDRRVDPNDPTQYVPLITNTPEYADPATWDFPNLITVYDGNHVECTGAPCRALSVSSTYPVFESAHRDRLRAHWQQFPATVEGFELMKQYTDQTWLDSIDLMTPAYLQRNIERQGGAMTATGPIAVPDAWQQKAELHYGPNNTATNITEEIRAGGPSGWCYGRRSGDQCLQHEYYGQAKIVKTESTPTPEPPPVVPSPDPEPVPPPVIIPPSPAPSPPPAGETWGYLQSIAAVMEPNSIRVLQNNAAEFLLPPDCGPNYAGVPGNVAGYMRCASARIAWLDWTGIAVDLDGGRAWLVNGGGHSDLGTNTAYRFEFATMTWAREHDGYPPASSVNLADMAPGPNPGDAPTCPEPTQGPMGSHDYGGSVYVASRGEIWEMRASGYQPIRKGGCIRRNRHPGMWAYRHVDSIWTPVMIRDLAFPRCASDQARDRIYCVAQAVAFDWEMPTGIRDRFVEINPNAATITDLGGAGTVGKGGAMAWSESERFLVYSMQQYRSESLGWMASLVGCSVDLDGARSCQTLVNAKARQVFGSAMGLGITSKYIIGFGGTNQIARYDRQTGMAERVTATGDTVPTVTGSTRIYGKFVCPPQVSGVCVGWPSADVTVIYKAE